MNNKKMFYVIIFIMIIFFFLVLFPLQHEIVHQQICKMYGGNQGNIYVDLVGYHTKCDIKITDNYLLAQSNVDSFGYQISIIGLIITIVMFMLFLARDYFEDENYQEV